jgi:chromosome segregation ATPase/pSer/pThr/pTyr-binding forkhead associated (FHA) protein
MKLWCSQRLIFTVSTANNDSPEIVVERPYGLVGSHAQADVVLKEAGIAERAIYFHATDNGVYYRILELENDLSDDGRFMRLSPNDELTVGAKRIKVRSERSENIEVLRNGAPEANNSRTPVLNVMFSNEPAVKRRLHAALQIVGSHAQCEIELKSPTVTPCHCVLFWYKQHLWCIDLHSQRGTRLNGQAVDCSEINLGDHLEIGDYIVQFHRFSQRNTGGGQAETPAPVVALPEQRQLPEQTQLPAPQTMPEIASIARSEVAVQEASPAVIIPVSTPIPDETVPAKASVSLEPLAVAPDLPQVQKATPPSLLPKMTVIAASPENVTDKESTAEVSFEPIHIQYGMSYSPIIQLESTPVGEKLSQDITRLQENQEALQTQWQSIAEQFRNMSAQVNHELAERSAQQALLANQFSQQLSEQRDIATSFVEFRQQIAQEIERSVQERQSIALEQASKNAAQQQTTERLALLQNELSVGTQVATQLQQELSAQLQASVQSQQELRERSAAVNLEITELTQALHKELQAITEQRTALQQEGSQATQEVQNLAARFVTLQNEHAEYRNALTQLSDALSSKMSELTTEQSQFRNQWQTLSVELKHVSQSLTQEFQGVVEQKQSFLDQRGSWDRDQQHLLEQMRQQGAEFHSATQGVEALRLRLSQELQSIQQQRQAEQESHDKHLADFKQEWGSFSHDLREDNTELIAQLRSEFAKLATERTQQQQLVTQAIAVQTEEWKASLSGLKSEFEADANKQRKLQEKLKQEIEVSRNKRADAQTQWQAIASEMQQLGASIKEQWNSSLSTQQTTISDANELTSRMADIQQHLAEQQQQMLALQSQISGEFTLISQERESLKQQWQALSGGLSFLGQQLRGETPAATAAFMTMENGNATISADSLALIQREFEQQQTSVKILQSQLAEGLQHLHSERTAINEQWQAVTGNLSQMRQEITEDITSQIATTAPQTTDHAVLEELREQLQTVKLQLQEEQKVSADLKAALTDELKLFSKEREATKLQWSQMSKAFANLGNQYREQVKSVADQRRLMTEEHDQLVADKVTAFEHFTKQTVQVVALQKELTELKRSLQEQVQSLMAMQTQANVPQKNSAITEFDELSLVEVDTPSTKAVPVQKKKEYPLSNEKNNEFVEPLSPLANVPYEELPEDNDEIPLDINAFQASISKIQSNSGLLTADASRPTTGKIPAPRSLGSSEDLAEHFVVERISEIDSLKRRNLLILWGVALTIALSGIVFGVSQFFLQ